MSKLQYFNQCDRWRTQYPTGEAGWQEMIRNKSSISMSVFKKAVSYRDILDEKETLDDFIASDSGSGFFRSRVKGNPVFFVESCGFEFIFTVDGKEPLLKASQDISVDTFRP